MTLPDYNSGTGFYDPGKTYTGYLQPQYPVMNITEGGPFNPMLYRSYATDIDPRAEYNRRLVELGLGGTGSRAKSAQGMFEKSQQGYGMAKLRSNFNLYYPEYLDQVDLQRVLESQSQEEQGLDPLRFGQRKYRWGMMSG